MRVGTIPSVSWVLPGLGVPYDSLKSHVDPIFLGCRSWHEPLAHAGQDSGAWGAHAVLEWLQGTAWPWQEAPWDFSIPHTAPEP